MNNIVKNVWDQTPSIIKYPIISVAGLALAVIGTTAVTGTKIELPLHETSGKAKIVFVSLTIGKVDDRSPFFAGIYNRVITQNPDSHCSTGVRETLEESHTGIGMDGTAGGASYCTSTTTK